MEMITLSSIIVSTCVGFTGSYNAACTNALTAGAKQSGVEKNMNEIQDRGTKFFDEKAKDLLGEKSMGIVGSAMWLKKVTDERKVTLGLPRYKLYDSANTELSESSAKLNLQWNF